MRVWTCHTCKHTYDLAVVVPELGGSNLSDEEYEALIAGGFHKDCPGPPEPSTEPKMAKTKYDWKAR